MKKLLAVGLLLASTLAAAAQTGTAVKQSGNITPGHAAYWVTNGVIADGGTAANGFLTSLGTVGNTAFGQCHNSGPITGPYQEICLGATTSGGSVITALSFGGAPSPSLSLNIGGTIYPLPFPSGGGVVGPATTTVGHLATWNNITGTLLADTGIGTALSISGGNLNFTPAVVSETGPDTVVATNCGGRYSLRGSALYTLTVPSASGFPLGCTFGIVNDDAFPTYTSAAFTGTISGTTMTTVGVGPTAVGQTLTGPVGAITSGTTITACPGSVCGGGGAYTISNSITLGLATFTGTAAASPHGKQLTVTAVTGTIRIGSNLTGTGVPVNTVILRQFSGTPGGAGVYLTSAATTASSASLTATPVLGSYATGGGRCKFLAGLTVTKLCPGQAIQITSLGGSGWAQPLIAPRWNMPSSNIRLFVSLTGSDTTGDGLGGCGAGGAPFATLQAVTNYLGRDFDLRNIDPWTVQFCPGSYSAGTQETHFPTDVPGRNGGAGIRITGSPLGLNQCIDSTAVILTSGNGSPVIDAQLPYVWIQPDCMTINPTNGPAVSAARGSYVLMSTGLIIGPGGGSGNTQLSASTEGHLLLDGSTTLIMTGDEASNGYWLNMGGAGHFNNIGGGDFAWDTGSSTTFNYTNAVIMGQGSDANFGGALWDVNGTIPATVSIDLGRLWTGNALPFGGFGLSSGACVNNAGTSSCAPLVAGSTGTSGVTSGNFLSSTANLLVDSGKAVPAGAVVGTTDTQTLTNKVIVGASNTLTVLAGSQLSGQTPVANGGTGASTVAGAIATLLTSQLQTAPITVNFGSAGDNAIPITLPTGYTQLRGIALTIGQCSASLAGGTFGLFTATGGGGAAIVTAGATSTITNNTANTNNNFQFFSTLNNANSEAYTPAGGNLQFRVGSTVSATCKISMLYTPVP